MILAMRSELRSVRTGGVPAVVDLTEECAAFVRGEGDGLLHVFVPHATAGVAIIETGSGSEEDLLAQLDVLQADGGTRTAAITGAYVALADAVSWLGERRKLARANAISTEPAGCFWKPRVIVTGRSSSSALPSALVTGTA